MKLHTFSDLEENIIVSGLIRQSKSGSKMTLALFTFDYNIAVPIHEHKHEQISLVIRGIMKYNIDGQELIAKPKQFVIIPPGCPHGATAISKDGAEVIDAFSPIRKDF